MSLPVQRATQSTDPETKTRTVRLLGPMSVSHETCPHVMPPLRKTKALLAILAFADGTPVSREQAAGLLWSTRYKESANTSLRQCVHNLRETLKPLTGFALQTDKTHLTLRTSDVWIDTSEVLRCTPCSHDALIHLQRGPLFEDLIGLDPAFDAWAKAENERIRRFAAKITEVALSQIPVDARFPPVAERFLRLDPCHEATWRTLMTWHARSGNLTLANEAYQDCVKALAEHRNTEPSEETKDLLARITSNAARPTEEPTLSRKTRINVVAMQSLGTSCKDFADGLTQDITTALTRFRSLSCSPKDGDFSVNGSVQEHNGRRRVTIRLNETRSGDIIWNHRFDIADGDILGIQDDIAAQASAQIDAEIALHASCRTETLPPTRQHMLLRALRLFFRLDKESFLVSGTMISEILRRDPSHALAHAWLSYWHILSLGQGWADYPEKTKAAVWRHVSQALTQDPHDAVALTISGHARAFVDGRMDEAIDLHQRALSLNPYLPMAWLFSGLAKTFIGHHEEAIRDIERARFLSPNDPHRFFFDSGLILPNVFRGDIETSLKAAQMSTVVKPTFSSTFKAFLVASGHKGNPEEGDRIRAHLLTLEPKFSVSNAMARSPLTRREDRSCFEQGLRLGGLTPQ